MIRTCCTLFFVLVVGNVMSEKIVELTVSSGRFDRYETPLSIYLEDAVSVSGRNLILYEWLGKEKVAVPFQVEESPDGPKLSWILSGNTAAGKDRKFVLESGNAPSPELMIVPVKEKDELVVYSGGDKVLAYHYETQLPPEGTAYEYRRSGFIHPLWSPSGIVLTDIQPADHPHHYGIMNPWTKTTFEGKEVDFWNLGKGQGTVRFKTFSSFVRGAVFGGFQLVQEHLVFHPGYEKVALNEDLSVKVWNVKDRKKEKAWLWDYISVQNCASDSALLLNEYRYGGLLFRARPEWTNETSVILTSEGNTRKNADGSLARWMLCSGKTPQGMCTVLIMSSPSNFNHPEPIRVWPEKSKYIFMNFSPTKDRDWLLLPGTDYTRRYRIVVSEEGMTAQEAERYWRDYATPPHISIRK